MVAVGQHNILSPKWVWSSLRLRVRDGFCVAIEEPSGGRTDQRPGPILRAESGLAASSCRKVYNVAVFNSAAIDAVTLAAINRDAIALMEKIGAAIPPGFHCDGLPIIQLGDETKKDDEPLDYSAFAGRLSFGGNMYSSDVSSYPAGPVRITVSRWGPDPDDCGKVIVGKTDLRSTSIVSCVGVTIGDNVTLGSRVVILDTNGHSVDRRKPDTRENKKAAPVFIEDEAWIGYGSVILKGVRIGRRAVVLPGSVVVRDVPAGDVVVGNPARSADV